MLEIILLSSNCEMKCFNPTKGANILYFCVYLRIATGSLNNKLGVLRNAKASEYVCSFGNHKMNKWRMGKIVGQHNLIED